MNVVDAARARFTRLVDEGDLVVHLLAIFVTVLGSRLWLVACFGSDIPFWDQWNSEGASLYRPYLEHGLASIDWFAPHNEHRIVLSRATSLALLILNGQWDPLVQMCWEAFCAAATTVMLCAMTARLLPARSVRLLWLLAVVGSTAPNGWENTLAGFQTPFFYLLIESFLVFHWVGYASNLTARRFVLVCIVGVAAIFTLAAGTLTCLAGCAGLMARLMLRPRDRTMRAMGLAASLLVIALIGLALTPTVAAHASLRAHGFVEAWTAFVKVMGWPTEHGLLVWAPLALWALVKLARRNIATSDVMPISLAAFLILNAAAIAWSRGAITDIAPLSSRYTDIAWLAWFVNLWAVALLVREVDDVAAARVVLLAAFVAGFVVAITAIGMEGVAAVAQAAHRGALYATETANTWDYVVRGDPAALRDKPQLAIPYPDPVYYRALLDDPTIRSILPPGIRPGVVQRSMSPPDAVAPSGLVLTGVPYGSPPAPPPANGYFYGTFGKQGDATTVHFATPPIQAQGRDVRVLVSGYAGRPGLSLYLEDAETGRRVSLMPAVPAGNAWVPVQVRIPGPRYRLVADDAAQGTPGWFAFTDPVELGTLRPFADLLLAEGRTLATWGLAALLGLLVLLPSRERWRRESSLA